MLELATCLLLAVLYVARSEIKICFFWNTTLDANLMQTIVVTNEFILIFLSAFTFGTRNITGKFKGF